MAFDFGTILKNQISLVDFLDQREIFNKIVDVTRERTAFEAPMLMAMMGRYEQTKETSYHNFVNVELFQKETITAAPTDNSGGAGTNVTVVVGNASGTSYPRVGDIIQVPGASRRQGLVTTKVSDAGGDQITLESVTGNDMELANGQILAVHSSAEEEGGGFVQAMNWKPVKRVNNIQIFAETVASITDVQKETWVEVQIDGAYKWLPQAEANGYFVFMKKIAMQMLFGEGSGDNFITASPSLTGPTSNGVSTTRGVNSYIETDGMNFPGAFFDQALLEAMARQMDKRRCPKLYQVWLGSEGCIQWDNLFYGLDGSPLSDTSRWQITGEDLRLGIEKYSIYGRTFAKVPMQAFNEQHQTNFTNSAGFQNMMFFIPDGGEVGLDGGGSAPYMRVRTLPVAPGIGPNASSNGIYRSSKTGNYAPIPTNKTRTLDVNWETKQGLEFLGADFGARVILSYTGS